MKKLSFGILFLNLFLSSMLWSLPAWAAETTYKICPAEIYGTPPTTQHIEGAKPSATEQEGIAKDQASAAGNGTAGASTTTNFCGTPEGNFLWKTDCTTEKKVITEVQEVIGSEITQENAVDGAFIINVYRGACCLVDQPDAAGVRTCINSYTFYTTDTPAGFDTCKTNSNMPCERRQWVIGGSGAGILKVYAKQIYTFAALMVGSVTVTNMVYSGVMITITGSSGDISAYRDRITQGILALVLLFASGVILYTVNPNFFG